MISSRARTNFIAAAIAFGAGVSAPVNAIAETITIGFVNTPAAGPIDIAQEKGYFAAEGLTVKLAYFTGATPIAIAVVSGDLDFGITGLTAAFYNLAGQGALRIIAGYTHEYPGFQASAFVVSNRAYAAGFHSFKDFPGHSLAVTQAGSTYDYALGLVADKYGFDFNSVRRLPMQGNQNIVPVIAGGEADAGLLNAALSIPLVQQGEAKLLGWVGDETPFQLGAVFTATKIANERPDTIKRFLRAWRKGTREFHDAFTGPDGKRADGPTAPAILAIDSKYVGRPVNQIKIGISYDDPDGRLDVRDVLRQIVWYKARNLVNASVHGEDFIDMRYVVDVPHPLP